jgi:NitT/TauT family transport system substrate-binding protein
VSARGPRRLALAALCAATLSASLAPVAAESAKPTKLRVTVSDVLSRAPFFIAEAEGYFADQGIEIEPLTFRSTNAALPGLAAGDVDVFLGTLSPGMLNLIARAGRVKIVLARIGDSPDEACPSHALVAKRELVESGRLETAADLRGLRVATERTASSFYAISTLLASAGLTLDDVEPAYTAERLEVEAFERDLLDVAATTEPWMTRILDGGKAVIWMPMHDIVPGFQYGFMVFGPSLLDRDRDAGQRFVTAYLRGVRQYAGEGKSDRNVRIVAERLRLDADPVRRMCWPYHPVDGQVDLDSLDRYQKWALQEGFLDRLLDRDAVWDRSFVDHARRVLDQAE